MKKLLIAITLCIMLLWAGGGTPAEANGPSYEDRPWTSAMNQTSYWAPWQCTKYERHNGHIPAQYDAAIIKNGSDVVRVYANLENVGAFTATHPHGSAPWSWVMKCTKPPVDTTTTSTTSTSTTSTTTSTTSTTTTTTEPEQETTTTTEPEQETTTTWPDTTSSTTTTSNPVTTTTVVDTTSTSSPSTTSPPETTATTTPGTTTGTTPGSSTPPTPGTPPSNSTLPETGTSSWLLVLLAGTLLLAGSGIVRISRRP